MHWLEVVLGFGEEAKNLDALEMAVRAVVTYLVILAMVRLGKKRFMARASAFDMIVGIILGSIASRAITGNAPMVPSMAACAAILLLHWLFSGIAVRWHGFGHLIKGSDRLLVKDGRVDELEMRKVHMSHRDLQEALREQGLDDVADVAEGRLERSGKLSVIKKTRPKSYEVKVAAGVQTVRIEIA